MTFFAHMCGDVRLLSSNHNHRMIRNCQDRIDVLGLGNFWVTWTNTHLLWRMCITYQPVMFLLNFMLSLMIFLRQWFVMETMMPYLIAFAMVFLKKIENSMLKTKSMPMACSFTNLLLYTKFGLIKLAVVKERKICFDNIVGMRNLCMHNAKKL